MGHAWVDLSRFGDDFVAICGPKSGLFVKHGHETALVREHFVKHGHETALFRERWTQNGAQDVLKRPKTSDWPFSSDFGPLLGPKMGHISARIGTRGPKRAQEGPTSVLGSDPEATLRHTYDLIDCKALKETKQRCLFYMGISSFFEQPSYRSLL